ncbi:hypothetical protein ACLFMI_22850 [Pseudonocardia nantongensis]|uniref:hypothetical protein n=1 Tax=Pseudonocardia nantongensis TaxID=1181885 RepID=UPI0039781CD8
MLSGRPPHSGAVRRPLVRWDVALSGCALALTGMLIALGMFGGVFLVAFLDYCPPKTCSSSQILVSVAGSLAVAVAAGIAGLAMTVLRIVERRISWPFAVIALVITVVAIAFGALDYVSAIGY